MKLNKLNIIITGFMVIKAVMAAEAYDNIIITPDTWQEADFTYTTYINGKNCINTANILRPNTWLNKRNINKSNVGKYIQLTKNDIGTDAKVKLVAIKPVTFSFNDKDAAKSVNRPVISTFKRCSNNVTDYTFKDESGRLETIQATPEHPFYSINRHDYVPIGKIWYNSLRNNQKEQIQTEFGKSVTLVNAKPHNGEVEAVYNFEVYKAHNYLVGDGQLLVHNECFRGVIDTSNPLGSGTHSTAYLQPDGSVIKVPKNPTPEIIASYELDAELFNLYHGDGTAQVFTYNDSVIMKSKYVPGQTIKSIINGEDSTLKAALRAATENGALSDMQKILEHKGIYHGDINASNLLFDSTSKTINPIDFAVGLKIDRNTVVINPFGRRYDYNWFLNRQSGDISHINEKIMSKTRIRANLDYLMSKPPITYSDSMY